MRPGVKVGGDGNPLTRSRGIDHSEACGEEPKALDTNQSHTTTVETHDDAVAYLESCNHCCIGVEPASFMNVGSLVLPMQQS